jgi:hypothetical protein
VEEAEIMISAEFPPFPCVLPHPWKSAICSSAVPAEQKEGMAPRKLCPPEENHPRRSETA